MRKLLASPVKLWMVLAGLLASSATFSSPAPTRIEFIGAATLDPGLEVESRVVGGLSGIAYDSEAETYYVVSDDPSARFPAGFFLLEIDLTRGRLEEGGVRVTGAVTLQDEPDRPFVTLAIDPEGVVLTSAGTLLISSEGQVAHGVAPFVREFRVDGRPMRSFAVPERYLPEPDGGRGLRNNLGFEALTITPDQRYVITATENALIQDGPESTLDSRSPSRIARFDRESASVVDEYLYWVERVASPSTLPGGLEIAGLVEMIALDENRFLSLERSFSIGAGNAIRLYLVSLEGATNIRGVDSLIEADHETIRPVGKQLLVDLADLGVNLDNLEGMAFGPQLADGRRSLIMVGDDNFNYPLQVTQFLAFAVSFEPARIGQVQGRSHTSPLEGQWMGPLSGVVTALQGGQEAGFWMQDSDGDSDLSTSDALQVLADHAEEVEVGDRVEVWGRVVEEDNRYGLTATALQASSVDILEVGMPLPSPIAVGQGGRSVPAAVVDNDGLRWFEPEYDAIDSWETLEGMRVGIDDPTVVGPSTHNGYFVVVPSGAIPASKRSAAGGVLLRPGDPSPERLVVDFRRLDEAPRVAVGDRFEGSLTGILDYRFGAYRLVATEALPRLVPGARATSGRALRGGKKSLTIATYNVLNLDPSDGVEHFRRLAESIVERLGSPDVIALQEIQDNSGVEDDGVVEADVTFRALIEAIQEVGGPAYAVCQIDPGDGTGGGRPGANIRVGYLFNPERVELKSRVGETGPAQVATARRQGRTVELSASPGLVAPDHPAFRGDERRRFEPSRKSLAAEFEFRGKRLFIVNNHLKSKSGDDPLFGARQPPLRITEDQRSQQAAVIGRWAADLHRLDPSARVVVLGDLNDHEFRSPLRILEGAGLVNLMVRVPAADRYTFNYLGSSQLLDHVLVSRSLYEETAPEVMIHHINADAAFDNRASDHDPVVVRFHLD